MRWARWVLLAGIVALGAPAPSPAASKQKPPIQYQIAIPPPPDFSAFDWLIGRWAGKTVSISPPGDVRLSVTSDLDKHVLVFREEVSLAATATVPASKESWMGILTGTAAGSGFVLRVFSTTGFVTRYQLTLVGGEIHFNPEGGDSPPPGWLFRRVWSHTGPDEFTETVQVAPPGKSFFDYYTAKLTRTAPETNTPAAPPATAP